MPSLPKATGKAVVFVDGSGSMQRHLDLISLAIANVLAVDRRAIVVAQDGPDSLRVVGESPANIKDLLKVDWRTLPFGGFNAKVMFDLVQSMNPRDVTLITDGDGPHKDLAGLPDGWRVIELPELTARSPQRGTRSTPPHPPTPLGATMPESRYATQDELASIDKAIIDATDKPVQVRAAVGAELNGKLRWFHSTPAVVDLRRRMWTDLLDIKADAIQKALVPTHPPEPWRAPEQPTEQHVVLLYDAADDEASNAYLVDGDILEANRIGGELSVLRGCDFNTLKVEPLPVSLTAEQTLRAIREAFDTSVFPEDVVARIAKAVGETWPRPVSA